MLLQTPLGLLKLCAQAGAVCGVYWETDLRYATAPEGDDAALLHEAARQLQAYFAGKLQNFDLPLALPPLTPFAAQVHAVLRNIPYGSTHSYSNIAAALGRASAVRAVAGVVARNPLLLLVPCHRVIGADGRMRGYSGGIAIKARLLAAERDRLPIS